MSGGSECGEADAVATSGPPGGAPPPGEAARGPGLADAAELSPARAMALPGGIALHVVERGQGEPVIFVHGGGKDHRYWRAQLAPFARLFRVIAYSRRYAWPNDNSPIAPDYSALTDAADLAALMDASSVESAHLVGASIGGAAALFFAVHHPERVRSLVLAEPPILGWARDVPEGRALLRQWDEEAWQPAKAEFARGEREAAMELIIDAFVGRGSFAAFPPAVRERVMENARDWEAQVLSAAAFPELARERLWALDMPVLLLTGGCTTPLHALVDAELAAALPRALRITIPGASHDMWADCPDECRAAALDFLARQAAEAGMPPGRDGR